MRVKRFFAIVLGLLIGLCLMTIQAAADTGNPEKEIFETDEFSFELPDSWNNNYYVGVSSKNGDSYYCFSDKNISYKSNSTFLYLIASCNKENLEKWDDYSYTELEGTTIMDRKIYMAVKTVNPELAPEDIQFEEEYLQMRSDCEQIPDTLQYKTELPEETMEIDGYTFYIPASWEGNYTVEKSENNGYSTYTFYQKKSLHVGGQLLTLTSCKYGYKPDLLDGAELLAKNEDTQKMYWMGGPTGVTCDSNNEEIREEYYHMYRDRQTIAATFHKIKE